MLNIKNLIDQRAKIEYKIRELTVAMNSKEKLKVGDHYHGVDFESNDPDLLALIELKISKFESELKPIVDRLDILDELASETVNKAKNNEL